MYHARSGQFASVCADKGDAQQGVASACRNLNCLCFQIRRYAPAVHIDGTAVDVGIGSVRSFGRDLCHEGGVVVCLSSGGQGDVDGGFRIFKDERAGAFANLYSALVDGDFEDRTVR